MLTQDRNQNYWELACISGTALGLPGMVIGAQLAQLYGAPAALTSILIGNVILWMLGMAILSMVGRRENAIENVRGYLGSIPSYFAAIVWTLAFLIWYALQIKSVSVVVSGQIEESTRWTLGLILGGVVALLGIGGIRLIKKICVISLPIIICYILYSIVTSAESVHFEGKWAISLPGIFAIVLIWLPGTVNLPTFFRHSLSKPDSVLGLSLVTAFHILFQISAIVLNLQDPVSFFARETTFSTILALGFILLIYILSNLLNIYYASAGLEVVVPIRLNRTKYFVVGLLGTMIFLMISSAENVLYNLEFLETVLSSFIATSGVVLLIAFIIRLFVRHRPNLYEKMWSSVCWFVGCITATVVQIQEPGSVQSITIGMIASALSYLVIIFIEEMVWSSMYVYKNYYKVQ